MEKRLPRVAFICTHNACRSQIAEAFGRALAADTFECYSAGTVPGDAVNPDAIRLMAAHCGLDLSNQRSKALEALPPVDIVITMGCGVECPFLPASHREDWGLTDPTGATDAVFLETIRTIRGKVLALRARIARGELHA